MSSPQVRCPQCAIFVEYSVANAFRPFCTERCKLIDLGAWASDQYAVPGKQLEGDDFSTLEDDSPVGPVPPHSRDH